MKIVDRKTFLALPEGTFYCKGVKWAFEDLCIKDETRGDDWWYLHPAYPAAENSGAAVDILEDSIVSGTSFPMEDAISRDGLHDADALFLIFEPDDLVILRGMIDKALGLDDQEARVAEIRRDADERMKRMRGAIRGPSTKFRP